MTGLHADQTPRPPADVCTVCTGWGCTRCNGTGADIDAAWYPEVGDLVEWDGVVARHHWRGTGQGILGTVREVYAEGDAPCVVLEFRVDGRPKRKKALAEPVCRGATL